MPSFLSFFGTAKMLNMIAMHYIRPAANGTHHNIPWEMTTVAQEQMQESSLGRSKDVLVNDCWKICFWSYTSVREAFLEKKHYRCALILAW